MSDTTHPDTEHRPAPPPAERPAWVDLVVAAVRQNTEALERNTRAQADRSVAEDYERRGI